MPRLQDKYRKVIAPALRKKFGIANAMATPRVLKIVVNTGTGKVQRDKKGIEKLEHDMAVLTGQKASVRKARKSIASFKLREGMPIGYAVTLRGKRMYDFLDRFVSLAIPRSKDFRGIELKNVDKAGNLNFGVTEHSIFPEIVYENLKEIFSLQVTVVSSTTDREQGIELFRQFGVPLKKPEQK